MLGGGEPAEGINGREEHTQVANRFFHDLADMVQC